MSNKMDDFGLKLTKLVKEFYPDVKFRVMFNCSTTIGNLFPFKGKTPFLLNSSIVYKIKCSQCIDFYIGKTSRCLIRRLMEQKTGKGTDEYKSALFKHQRDTGYLINYDNVEIIA